jgi:hypothetical protein
MSLALTSTTSTIGCGGSCAASAVRPSGTDLFRSYAGANGDSCHVLLKPNGSASPLCEPLVKPGFDTGLSVFFITTMSGAILVSGASS